MKKGLLTVLLASLVLVGCQNYDDQFDDLNAQISALKSQVDGLASLTSQVSSLQGTISGLQSGIAAAQAAATAAGASADAATAAATAAGTTATANATAIAAATAAATAAGASADAATAAATAATEAATAAITEAALATAAGTAAGVTATANAAAIAAATAAATAAGVSADAATAAAEAATAAATSAIAEATAAATAAAEATTAATTAGTDAVAAAALAAAAATTAGEDATAAAAAAEAAATAAGASAVDAAALATAAATAATTAAEAATAAAGANTTSLTALAAEVDAVAAALAAVQVSLATVSTAEEVAALQTEIDAIEADLEDLLNSSNVYQGALTIDSATTLASVNALGNAINIVNGAVTITNVSTYNQTTVQAVINRIFTVNGAYTFNDINDDTDENTASPTFDLLASAGDITMTNVNGAISFATLTTAGQIDITGDTWDNDEDADTDVVDAISSFSAPVLANVTSFDVGGNDTIDISGVGTSININSFTSATGSSADAETAADSLTIATAAGGTLTASAMESPDDAFAFDFTGLASYTNPSGIDAADITVTSIPTVTINDLQGALTVGTGVVTLTADDLYEVDLSGADELVSATLDMTFADSTNTDYDVDAAEDDKGDGLTSVSVTAANSDLTALTVTGNLMNLSVASSNVVTLTVGATMNNLTVSSSDDLTSISVSDASIRDIIISDNDAVATLTLDNDQNFAYERDADDDADDSDIILRVVNNDDLTSLTASGGTLNDVDITGNSTLVTVDLSGLTTTGGTSPDFDINSNDLNAASIVETDATAGTGTTDAGTSGMETLATLLAAITADLDATATIYFDSAETISDADGELNNGNDISYTDGEDDEAYLVVLEKTAGEAGDDGVDPGTETQAVGVVPADGDVLAFAVNGVDITMATMTGDIATDMAAVLASSGVDTALSAGAVVSAKRGYNSSSSVTVSLLTAGTTALYGERYNTVAAVTAAATETNHGIGAYDQWTLEIGDESVTTSFTTDISTSASLVEAWVSAWDGLLVDLAVNGDDNTKIDITAASTALDSTSYDLDIAISVTDSSTASSVSGAAVDYIIGDTRLTTDNATVDEGFIVTFTSTAAGATNNTLASLADGASDTMTTDNDYMSFVEAPADSVEGSDEVAASVTDDGNDTDRTGWL
jgi:hypothetical protein